MRSSLRRVGRGTTVGWCGAQPLHGGERGAVAQRVAVRTHVHRAAASVRCGHRSGVVRFAMAPTATAPTTGWAPPSVTGLLERIAANNVMQVDRSLFVPFMLGNSVLGYLSASFVEQLMRFDDTFTIRTDGSAVEFVPALSSPELRTAAVAVAMATLRDEGFVTGWRDEMYPVAERFGSEPVFLVERAAAGFFGIKGYGVHVNGYVQMADGSKKMWLGRRSSQKPTWPGMLDHIVAGGQPHGISVVDNMRKECEEEASIPAALAQHAVPVGVCSYEYSNAKSLRRDVIFCYDLLLPDSFVPAPLDGEVEEFLLLPVEEVAEIVNNTTSTTPRTAQFKDNCNLVVIDFLVRHGYLTPERPEYLQILKELRTGDWS